MATVRSSLMVILLVSWGLYPLGAGAFAEPREFGRYPVCEPSAVAKITCPDSDGSCLLVGDNESDDTLFLYPVQSGRLDPAAQTGLGLGQLAIDDIEAIAKLDEHRVLIMGSHSRNKECETKKKRRRFVQASVTRDKLEVIGPIIESPAINAKDLFGAVDLASNDQLAMVGRAIDDAEARADQAEGDETACNKVNAFNAEGAVAIPERASAPEVWVGLRAPLVRIDSENYAVLLRMASLDMYRFDGAAFLKIEEGRGIRELTMDENWIWGIAGGPRDDQDNFVLWRIPRDALKPNATLRPEIIRSLPASSEGLAIVDETAYVLIDGDRGDGGTGCKASARYVQCNLPCKKSSQ
jgi:hypothetical protein